MKKNNGKTSIEKKIKYTKCFKIAPVCLMTWFTLGYIAPAQAVVIPDRLQADKPIVHQNANGSFTVDINDPSYSGVSHNKFSQFDVTKQGVVLNNSTGRTGSLLAGAVSGNSKLSGAANLIINEVTSNVSSQLNGMVEVAGKKADVIIANPAGISCDGCGFINTKRSMLTTGKVDAYGGWFSDISVDGGKISFTGNGMNDESDYTALLAQTVSIQSKIKANDLQIMVGSNNNVQWAGNQLQSSGSSGSSSNRPYFGLDSHNFGGMYANKITVIANQDGVGVRSHSDMFSNGDINIQVNGKADLDAFITAAKKINIYANSIYSFSRLESLSDDVNVTSKGLSQFHYKLLAPYGNININSDRVEQYESLAAKNINIDANEYYSRSGKVGTTADNNLNINANSRIDIAGDSVLSSKNGTISLISYGKIAIEDSSISGKDVVIEGPSFTNAYYKTNRTQPGIYNTNISAKNDINLKSDYIGIINENSLIEAGRNVNIGDLYSGVNPETINYGTISAGASLNYLTKNSLTNSGVMRSNGNINIGAKSFNNNKVINGIQGVDINAVDYFGNNIGSKVSSTMPTNIRAKKIYNAGTIDSRNGVTAYTDTFNNYGNVIGSITYKPYY